MKSIREALETIEHIDRVRQLDSVQSHMESDLYTLQQAITEHLGRIGRCFPEWLHRCDGGREPSGGHQAHRGHGLYDGRAAEVAAMSAKDILEALLAMPREECERGSLGSINGTIRIVLPPGCWGWPEIPALDMRRIDLPESHRERG